MNINNENIENKKVSHELVPITKGAGFSFFGNIFGKGSRFIITFILTRILTLSQFGLYTLGETVIDIFSNIANLGLNRGSIKYIVAFKNDKFKIRKTIIFAIVLSLISGTLVGLLIFLFSEQIALLFKEPDLNKPLKIFAIAVPLLSLLSSVAGSTVAFKTTKYLVLGSIVFRNLTHLALIVVFYFLGLRFFGVIWAFVGSILISITVTLYYLKKLYSSIDFRQKVKNETQFEYKVFLFDFFYCD